MKPILLEIEGFNSFLQKEVIDFSSLTSRGIFGIFGPTGSGKSSILDAIIFALYGKTPRANTMNTYINMNTDTAKIRYIFSIKGENRGEYEIQRKIKRTKSQTSSDVKLINLDKNEILADKSRDFDDKIQEIIGLDITEFTQTVVLPQGKFSDFLLAQNKDRKKILENIFSLRKYGEALDQKISEEKRTLEQENKSINDQIIKYEDINQEKIDEKKEKIKSLQEKINDENKYIEEKENLLKDKENTLEILEKLRLEKEEKTRVLERKTEIDEKREFYGRLEKVQRISDKIISFIPLKKEITSIKENIIKIEEKKTRNDDYKKEIEENLEKITPDKEKIPEKKQEIEKYINAIENIEKKESYTKEKLQIKKEIEEKTETKDKIAESINKNKEQLIDLEKIIKELNDEKDKLSGDKEKNRQVENLYQKDKKVREIDIESQNLEKEKNNLSKNNIEIKKIIDELLKEEDKKDSEISKLKKIKIEEIFTPEIFAKETEVYTERLLIYEKKDDLNKKISENQEIYSNLKKEIKTLSEEIEKEKIILENIELNIDKYKLQEKIYQIQRSLKKGDICPVCGNIYEGEKDFNISNEKLTKLLEDKKIEEEKIKTLNENLSNIEARRNYIEQEIEKLKNNLEKIPEKILTKEKSSLIKRYDDYKIAYDKAQQEQKERQTQIELLTKDRDDLIKKVHEKRENYASYMARESEIGKSIQKLTIEKKSLTEEIMNLQKKYDINDIKKSYEILLENEKKIIPITEKIKSSEKELTNIKDEKEKSENLLENSSKILNSLIIKENTIITNLDLIENNLKKYDFVDENTRVQMIEENIESIKEKISKIEKTYEKLINLKEECEKKSLEIYKNLEQNKANLETKTNVYLEDEKTINDFISKNSYENFEELLSFTMKIEEMEMLKKTIEEYDNILKTLTISISQYEEKINGKDAKTEEVDKLREDLKEKKEEFDKDKEKLGSLKSEKTTLEKDLEYKNKLLENNRNLIENLEEINHLQSVLKGRKYVQFLSKYNLDMICKMASEKLIQISQGKYEILMDEKGEFLIKDYRNGGVEREPNTLSGGEIFIVSMSLAIALSTKIQLKGKARLEFFFLDEGFGTLDQKTLEEALEVLSKLKNDNLSIGIISHVEEVKNFMPIKLIVSPPNLARGSEVEIKI